MAKKIDMTCPDCGATLKLIDHGSQLHCDYCDYTAYVDGSDNSSESEEKIKELKYQNYLKEKEIKELKKAKREDSLIVRFISEVFSSIKRLVFMGFAIFVIAFIGYYVSGDYKNDDESYSTRSNTATGQEVESQATDKYIESFDELSDDILDRIASHSVGVAEDAISGDSSYISTPEHQGFYLMVQENERARYKNILYSVLKSTATASDGEDFEMWFGIEYDNIELLRDGNYQISWSYASAEGNFNSDFRIDGHHFYGRWCDNEEDLWLYCVEDNRAGYSIYATEGLGNNTVVSEPESETSE